jgi:beta-1,4-mannosyltransferase
MKKIAIFPSASHNKNPYLYLIEACLKKAGFSTKRIPNRKFFPFFQLLDNEISIVHFHWPHDFYIGKNFFTGILKRIMLSMSLFILKRVKIIYFADNLISHNINTETEFERKWIQKVVSSSDRIICSTKRAKTIFSEFYDIENSDKICIIPHPSYTSFYPNEIRKANAKKHLGIKDNYPVLVALGFIKSYKGFEQILEHISSLKNIYGTFIIAGECHNEILLDKIKLLIKHNQSNIKIILKIRFIKDDELQIYYKAADGAVLNYLDYPMNPGSIILAMGFGLNIIAPLRGSIPELVPKEALYGFDNKKPNQIRLQLKKFFQSSSLNENGMKCKVAIEKKHSIEVVAETYRNMYNEILGN